MSEASTSTTNRREGSEKVKMGAILGSGGIEGGCHRTVVMNEALVVIRKTQKALQLLNAVYSDNEPQEQHLGVMELTLLCLYKQLALQQSLKDTAHVAHVPACSWKISDCHPNIQNQTCSARHLLGFDCRSTGQTKRHQQKVIVATWCVKGSLQLIPLINVYQVISIPEI